ncbi:hypothetical protein [Streptomyces sp. NPDC001415]
MTKPKTHMTSRTAATHHRICVAKLLDVAGAGAHRAHASGAGTP